MEFDSLAAAGGAGAVKNNYSANQAGKKVRANSDSEKVNTDSAGAVSQEKVRAPEKSGESGKYNQDDLYKGENFRKKMEEAISQANKVLAPTNKSFKYSVHDETHEIVIQIKDNETGEVIKEIPSEESLDRIATFREQAGVVIDEKR